MTPLVPMKSATGIPLSAWMFLKVCSEVGVFVGATCFAGAGLTGVTACWANTPPTKHRTVSTAMNRISLGKRFIGVALDPNLPVHRRWCQGREQAYTRFTSDR